MFARTARPIEVIWCSNQRQGRSNGWSFPPAVARALRQLTAGRTVLHLFGGRARFGVRLDIDPQVAPDVIGDAWLPPFGRDTFAVVVLDPPYVHVNAQMKDQLLRAAAYIAREHVYWFHTTWIGSGSRDVLTLERAWLVRVGDSCAVRALQAFHVQPGAKQLRRPHFTRGPAIRYNRWLAGQDRLPFQREATS